MSEVLKALREYNEYDFPTERWQSTGQLIHEAAVEIERLTEGKKVSDTKIGDRIIDACIVTVIFVLAVAGGIAGGAAALAIRDLF